MPDGYVVSDKRSVEGEAIELDVEASIPNDPDYGIELTVHQETEDGLELDETIDLADGTNTYTLDSFDDAYGHYWLELSFFGLSEDLGFGTATLTTETETIGEAEATLEWNNEGTDWINAVETNNIEVDGARFRLERLLDSYAIEFGPDGGMTTWAQATELGLEQPFTVTMWFKGYESDDTWFFGDYDGNDQGGNITYDRAGPEEFQLYDGEGDQNFDVTHPYGEWVHVSLTGEDDTYTLFLDGEEEASISTSEPVFTNTDRPISAGNAYGNTGTTDTDPKSTQTDGEGKFNDLRTFNVALADEQIMEISNLNVGVAEEYLTGWWPMTEGEGDWTNDDSGNGNDGELFDAVWGDFELEGVP